MKKLTFIVSLFLLSIISSAQVIVDGIKSNSEYPASLGNPIAVQTVQTQFGDSNNGLSGSELDALYYNVDDNNLYIFIAGNLEPNFNKLMLFFDAIPGGQNTIALPIPDVDIMDIIENMAGMQLDAGFDADYFINIHNAPASPPSVFFGQFGQMTGQEVIDGGPVTSLPNGIMVAINNDNNLGIMAGTGAANQIAAEAVMTGAEYKIPFTAIGVNEGDIIKLMAFIGNENYNFNSNQFLPGLQPPQENLGGDGSGGFTGTLSGINLNNFAGTQFAIITLQEQMVIPTLSDWGLIIILLLFFISGILFIKIHLASKFSSGYQPRT